MEYFLKAVNNFEKIVPILIIILSITAAIMYAIKIGVCGSSTELRCNLVYWIAAAVLNISVVFR